MNTGRTGECLQGSGDRLKSGSNEVANVQRLQVVPLPTSAGAKHDKRAVARQLRRDVLSWILRHSGSDLAGVDMEQVISRFAVPVRQGAPEATIRARYTTILLGII